jgi:cytochrome P450
MQLIEGHKPIAAPDNVPEWDVDPYDPEILRYPTEFYRQLRDLGPFVYLTHYSILACGRYAETREVFSDWQRFVSSRGVGLQDFSLEKPWRPASIVLEVDPPYHDKTRSVILRAMSPRAVANLRESFKTDAELLIDSLLQKQRIEAVAELAETYPTRVFPKAVGLQQADRRKLVDYGSMVFNALGPDNDLRRQAMAMGPDIVPWITEQCRRDNLSDDGFGATIYAAADSGEISEDEAAMLVRSLLSAGVDTTVTLIGNTLWCLATHPGQFEKLKANPQLAKSALEETLRYTSPVHAFCRTAQADTSVSDIAIEEGSKILCVLGSANLDERHWPNADQFDIERNSSGHMALGAGIHACVGQNVARAEGTAILTAIAENVSTLELAGEPVWRPGNAIHALAQLPLKLG